MRVFNLWPIATQVGFVCWFTVQTMCALAGADQIPVTAISAEEMKRLADLSSTIPGSDSDVAEKAMVTFNNHAVKARSAKSGSMERRGEVEAAVRIAKVPSGARVGLIKELLLDDAKQGKIDLIYVVSSLDDEAISVRPDVVASISSFLSIPGKTPSVPAHICSAALRAYPGDRFFVELLKNEIVRFFPADESARSVTSFYNGSFSFEAYSDVLQGIVFAAHDDPAFRKYISLQCSNPSALVRWNAGIAAARLGLPIVNASGVRLLQAEEMAVWFPFDRNGIDGLPVVIDAKAQATNSRRGGLMDGAPAGRDWWIERFAIESTGIQAIAACRALVGMGGVTTQMVGDLLGAGALLDDSNFHLWAVAGIQSFSGSSDPFVPQMRELLNSPSPAVNSARHVLCLWLSKTGQKRSREMLVVEICRTFQRHFASMSQIESLDTMHLISVLGAEAAMIRPWLTRIAIMESAELRGHEKEDAEELRYGAILTLASIGAGDDLLTTIIDGIRHENDPMLVAACAKAAGSLGRRGVPCVEVLLTRLRAEVEGGRAFYRSFSLAHPTNMFASDPSEWTTAPLEMIRALGNIGSPEVRPAEVLAEQVLSKYQDLKDRGREQLPTLEQVKRVVQDFKATIAAGK